MSKNVCHNCGAPAGNCCAISIIRRDTADAMGKLVDRQSRTIARLERELGEARQVAADLRTKAAA